MTARTLTRSGVVPLVALVAGVLAAVPAGAQTQNGGIVNGQHHEPNPAQVLPAERRDGVAASSGQAGRNQSDVDQLGQDLLKKEQTDPPTRSSVPPIQDGQPAGPR